MFIWRPIALCYRHIRQYTRTRPSHPWAPRANLPIYTFLYLLCSWQTRSSGVQVKSWGQCRVRPSVSLIYVLAGVSWASTGHVRTRDTTAGDRRPAIACVRINDVTTNASHLYDLCPTAGRTPPLPDRRCARRRRSRPYRWVRGLPRDRDRHHDLRGSEEEKAKVSSVTFHCHTPTEITNSRVAPLWKSESLAEIICCSCY